MNFSKPLDKFPLLRTREIEEVEEVLGRVYARPTSEILRTVKNKRLDASINLCQLQHVALGYTRYGADLSLSFPAGGFFLQFFPVIGKGEIAIDKMTVSLTRDTTAIVSPNSGYVTNYHPDYEFFILRIDPQALAAKLAAITGVTISAPLRMSPQTCSKKPGAQVLRQYIPLLADTMDNFITSFPDWWISQSEELLMTLFLFGNQHNYSHLLEARQADAAPWQVRRAEEYIAENVHQAISLEEIAAITGVSAFSLFRSFKKSRGYSPLEFASRLRANRGGAQ